MISKQSITSHPIPGASPPRVGINPWIKLVIGFVLVWMGIFVFGHLARFIPGADHMAKVIDEHDLRATAIYYTDLDETYEGSEYIRHSLEYPPRKEQPW